MKNANDKCSNNNAVFCSFFFRYFEMENILEKQLLKVAESIEQKLDQEIQKLDELDLDSIENIREHRLQQMKKMIKQKEEWMAKVKVIFIYWIIIYLFLKYIS